jgi:hypothetical protein
VGAPCPCSYATLSYALQEVQTILSKFAQFLLLLKRLIDDIFCIWVNGPGEELEKFKKALEGSGQLKWICSDLKDSVVFLDITLSINKQGSIETKTFIKRNNFHCTHQQHPPTHQDASKEQYSATSSDIGARTPTQKTTTP